MQAVGPSPPTHRDIRMEIYAQKYLIQVAGGHQILKLVFFHYVSPEVLTISQN
jgi:hypothetical protein